MTVFSRNTQDKPEPQDSGKRRTSHPTTQYAQVIITKWGLPKGKRRKFAAIEAMRKAFLNIPQGNTAPIVVKKGTLNRQGLP